MQSNKNPKVSTRLSKYGEVIHRELSTQLRRNTLDPRLVNVHICSVDMSPDLRYAKVFYSVLDPNTVPAMTKLLKIVAPKLRHLLAKSCRHLRVIPELHFYHDESILQGQHLSSLLNQLVKDEGNEQQV